MLKDIGQLPFFSAVIADQKRVIKFITNHHATLGIFRGLAEKELLKTGADVIPCLCISFAAAHVHAHLPCVYICSP